MSKAERTYLAYLQMNVPPEEARTVLPNSTKTEIVVTANMREWRHILKLRAAGYTGVPHPQMAEVMIPLLLKLRREMTELFGDIEIQPCVERLEWYQAKKRRWMHDRLY